MLQQRNISTVLALFLFAGFCDGLTYFYGNGSYYEGEVDESGRPSGTGQFYTRKGGLTYNGTFSEGMFNGTGVWYGADGHTYQGDFVGGMATGAGSWSTPTGDTIHGEFMNHTVHGEALWVFSPDTPKLDKMVGVFRRGLANGNGIVFFKDGSRLESKFKKGYPHGPGILYSRDDTKIWEGIIWNGIPMGIVPENVAKIFSVFYSSPLRLEYTETS